MRRGLSSSMELSCNETWPQLIDILCDISHFCEDLFLQAQRQEEARLALIIPPEPSHPFRIHPFRTQIWIFHKFLDNIGMYGQGTRSAKVLLKNAPESVDNVLYQLDYLSKRLMDYQELSHPHERRRQDTSNHGKSSEISDELDIISPWSIDIDIWSDHRPSPGLTKDHRAYQGYLINRTLTSLYKELGRIKFFTNCHRNQLKVKNQRAYNEHMKSAIQMANARFPAASEAFRHRLAESFARRRIKLDCLYRHAKKEACPKSEATKDILSFVQQSQACPPPPRVTGKDFHCPCCHIDFPACEAEGVRWKKHVMLDFEPYFCLFDDCHHPFTEMVDLYELFDHLEYHLQRGGERITNVQLGQHMEVLQRPTVFLQRGWLFFGRCPFCGICEDYVGGSKEDFDKSDVLKDHIVEHFHDVVFLMPPK